MSTAPNSIAPRRYRLAIVASHVIQYHGTLYRALAQAPEIDLTVLFCSREGLESYFDTGFGREVKWDTELLSGYRFEFLSNWSFTSPDFFGRINPGIVWRVLGGRYDAIWVNGWGRCTDWIAMPASFAAGVPVLMRGDTNLQAVSRGWRSRIRQAVLPRLFRRVSAFLASGRYNAEFYRACGVPDEKIFLMPHAVDNDFFISHRITGAERLAEIRGRLGIASESVVILFAGKFMPLKRTMDLLRAFESIARDCDATLVYVGDGEMRPQLEAYVRDHRVPRVIFTGFRNQGELPELFSIGDMLVLPSDTDMWGLVVNEAMCYGMPVIASNRVGATGDAVIDGKTGYVFPCGDVEALASRMRTLATDHELRRRMGHNARKWIDTWSFRENVAGLLAALKAVCGS